MRKWGTQSHSSNYGMAITTVSSPVETILHMFLNYLEFVAITVALKNSLGGFRTPPLSNRRQALRTGCATHCAIQGSIWQQSILFIYTHGLFPNLFVYFISLLRRRDIVHIIDWAGCFSSRFTNDTQLSGLPQIGSGYIPGQLDQHIGVLAGLVVAFPPTTRKVVVRFTLAPTFSYQIFFLTQLTSKPTSMGLLYTWSVILIWLHK